MRAYTSGVYPRYLMKRTRRARSNNGLLLSLASRGARRPS